MLHLASISYCIGEMTNSLQAKKKKVLLPQKFLSVLKKKCENNFRRNVIYVQTVRGVWCSVSE